MHRVTQPLPWALDHVHCYAVDDAEGWTLIDCGLGTPGTGRRWVEALARLGNPHVRRLVITHYHPDHIGASTRLAELTGAAGDRAGQARSRADGRTPGSIPSSAERFGRYLVAHGMPVDDAERSVDEEDELPIAPVEPTHLVDEGDTLDLAGEPFDVLVMPGHADGHIVLLGRRSGRMFGGDVLLNEITPNVGPLGGQRSRPARRLPAHAAADRGAGAGRRLPRASQRDRRRRRRARRRSPCTTPCASTTTSAPCTPAPAARTTSRSTSSAARSASTSSASRWPRRSRTSSGSSGWAARVQDEPNRWLPAGSA